MDLRFLGQFDEVHTYTRVSSREQAFDRLSIEGQRNRLGAIQPPPTHRWEDVQSGKDSDRPDYQRMIAAVVATAKEARRVLVVVTDQTRLSREDTTTVLNLVELFDELGIVLYSLDGGLLTVRETAQWLSLGAGALFSSYFLRQHSDRLKKTYKQKRVEGRPTCPSPPYGYLWSREKYIPNPETRAIARNAILQYLPPPMGQGMSLKSCAKWAMERGWKITPHGFRVWLKNPVLRGMLVYTDGGNSRAKQKNERERRKELRAQGLPVETGKPPVVEVYNTHEPLMSHEEYQRILARLAENGQYARSGVNAPRYPLSGLCYCGECGRRASRKTTTQGGKRYGYFKCQNVHCFKRFGLSELKIEAALFEALHEAAEAIAQNAATPAEEFNPEIARIQAEIEELEKIYARSPMAGIRAALDELRGRLEVAQDRPTRNPDRAQIERSLQNFRNPAMWPKSKDVLSQPERRALYHLLCQRIDIRDGKAIVTLAPELAIE